MKKTLSIFVLFFVSLGGYYVYNHLRHPSPTLNFHHGKKNSLEFEKWIAFSPQEESFAAFFPKNPETILQNIPISGDKEPLSCTEYICDVDGAKRFSISHATLPDEWLKYGDSLVLGGALKVIMKNIGKVHLIGKQSTVFKDFPALDYEHDGETIKTAGTLVLVKNTLYKIEMTYPIEHHNKVQNELINFIESFTPITSSTQHQHSEVDTPQSQR